jgi:hypothetical protein
MNLLIGGVRPHHAHRYVVKSMDSKGHHHFVDGITRVVNGNNIDRHVHMYRGVTTFDKNHYHRYYGKTGPAIPLPDGSHYHEIEERTFYNYDEPIEIKFGGVIYGEHDRPKHDHWYKGRTIDIVGNDPFFNEFFKKVRK